MAGTVLSPLLIHFYDLYLQEGEDNVMNIVRKAGEIKNSFLLDLPFYNSTDVGLYFVLS